MVDLVDEWQRKAKRCTFARWMEGWANGVDLWKSDFSKPGPNPIGTGK